MFRPKIVGFVCNWSLPADLEIVSPKGAKGYPKIHVVRMTCVGRIDPVIVLDTFVKGADGVLIIGCPSPDCHYVDGNLQAERKVRLLKKLLVLTGLEQERLRLEWVYAANIEPFVKIVDDFRDKVTALGSSPLFSRKLAKEVEINILAAKSAAADFRLRVLTGREEELTEARNVYGEIIPVGDYDELLSEVAKEEFIQHKIHILAKRKPLSIRELAEILHVKPAFVLCHVVNMRRKGMIALNSIEKTTPSYKSLEA